MRHCSTTCARSLSSTQATMTNLTATWICLPSSNCSKRSSKTSSLPNWSTSSQTLQATSISLSDCKPRAATTANITICSASTWSAARSRFLPTRRETTFTANTTSIRARDTITISKPRTAATILQRTARTNTSAQASLQAQDTPTIQAIATRTKRVTTSVKTAACSWI